MASTEYLKILHGSWQELCLMMCDNMASLFLFLNLTDFFLSAVCCLWRIKRINVALCKALVYSLFSHYWKCRAFSSAVNTFCSFFSNSNSFFFINGEGINEVRKDNYLPLFAFKPRGKRGYFLKLYLPFLATYLFPTSFFSWVHRRFLLFQDLTEGQRRGREINSFS